MEESDPDPAHQSDRGAEDRAGADVEPAAHGAAGNGDSDAEPLEGLERREGDGAHRGDEPPARSAERTPDTAGDPAEGAERRRHDRDQCEPERRNRLDGTAAQHGQQHERRQHERAGAGDDRVGDAAQAATLLRDDHQRLVGGVAPAGRLARRNRRRVGLVGHRYHLLLRLRDNPRAPGTKGEWRARTRSASRAPSAPAIGLQRIETVTSRRVGVRWTLAGPVR
jgi:hypothetical protein